MLTVRYSCQMSDWLKGAAQEVQKDHLQRSPDCTAKKLDEFLIPVAGANRVGEIARS